MKKFVLALNFKNNLVNANNYVELINLTMTSNVEVIVFPSFLQIQEFSKMSVKLGAQNVQDCTRTITGEISVEMLKKYGVKYCLVGHSERQESIEQITNKIIELLGKKITPVLCVGESEQISINESKSFIKDVVGKICDNKIDLSKIIIAYEPVYAIGKSESCDLKHIQDIVKFLKENFNFLSVLYGGSVNTNTFKQISKIPNLDGVLVGKDSLKAKNIVKMMRIYENIKE